MVPIRVDEINVSGAWREGGSAAIRRKSEEMLCEDRLARSGRSTHSFNCDE